MGKRGSGASKMDHNNANRKRKANDSLSSAPASKKQQRKKLTASAKTPKAEIPLQTAPFFLDPRGTDLQKEVELYAFLKSEDLSERLAAANSIISGLFDGDGVEEATLQRHLERRLFRGLASGVKAARLGYSIVLAEILAQLFGDQDLAEKKYPNLSFNKVLDILIAKTKPEGDLDGQETKDHFIGLLFGLQTFVRANILLKEMERWIMVLDMLIVLQEKRSWIREECGWVIIEAVAQMNESNAQWTLRKLGVAGLASTPEGVGIWLTVRDRFPDMEYPLKPWGTSGNPLKHLKTLAKALKESHDNKKKNQEPHTAAQTGNWNPKLHFVWDLILQLFADGGDGGDDTLVDFANFWKVAVDENLFSKDASVERKFWGLLLFQRMLEHQKKYAKLLPSIFSRNLVRCLINHTKEQDRFLNKSAEKSLDVMVHAVEASPLLLSTVLLPLIGDHGKYNFDTTTKTRTIDKLLRFVDDDNASMVINALIEPTLVVKVDGDEAEQVRETELRRQFLADYVLFMVRNSGAGNSSETVWVKETAVPTVARIAYCEDARFDPPLSSKTRAHFGNCLISISTHVLTDLSQCNSFCQLVGSLKPNAVAMDSKVSEAKDQAKSTMKKLMAKGDKASADSQAPYRALSLLYALVILQLYDGDSDAVNTMEELKACYDNLIQRKTKDDEDVDASTILVELLLSFISKPSALLRRVSQHVFSAFMNDVTAEGLKLMTDVLETKENLKGQQELFDQQPEDEEEPEDDDDVGMDSDVEVTDMNGEKGHLNSYLVEAEEYSKESEEDDGDSDEDDDDDDDEDAVKQLNDALGKVLGSHTLDPNAEESDSDADMTDSEMMQLDLKLVEIFSQTKKTTNKKREKKDAKERIVNFKIRILDLLDLYVKKQTRNPLAFGLLLPLLQLARRTTNKILAEKAIGIILSFAKHARKSGTPESVDIEAQLELMTAFHFELTKKCSPALSKAASTSCMLVASNLFKHDKKSIKKIAKKYSEAQISWVLKEKNYSAVMFTDWNNWCQAHAIA
ncbi:putative DNA polymerase V [Amylocarpus encephaloides]|uniref:DNA polymerase V n=1 Tax=Amylocarpus encephaloides TaxID=45428 RepID=A0A9P8C8J7_9HELO|nr:putative DNA polymerase V [Amylocarpus encephaloides]